MWNIAKWPVMFLVVVLIVALLYYATPNVQQPRFRWISIGALLAIVSWAVVSAAFGFYVANFSSYDTTYGALGGVIAFLLWLWLTNLALLFGAELDAELERGRELQSGLPAERRIQLPPRDTHNIDKARTQGGGRRAPRPPASGSPPATASPPTEGLTRGAHLALERPPSPPGRRTAGTSSATGTSWSSVPASPG